jgi:hypothetical protein
VRIKVRRGSLCGPFAQDAPLLLSVFDWIFNLLFDLCLDNRDLKSVAKVSYFALLSARGKHPWFGLCVGT